MQRHQAPSRSLTSLKHCFGMSNCSWPASNNSYSSRRSPTQRPKVGKTSPKV